MCIPFLGHARDFSHWRIACDNTHRNWFRENFKIRAKDCSTSSCIYYHKYTRYGKAIQDSYCSFVWNTNIGSSFVTLVTAIDICYVWIWHFGIIPCTVSGEERRTTDFTTGWKRKIGWTERKIEFLERMYWDCNAAF